MSGPALSDGERRANAAAGELFDMVRRHCGMRREMSRQLIEEVEQIVRGYTVLARQDGIPFPDLVVVSLEITGGIEVVRRDLDDSSITQLILNISAKYAHHAVRSTDIAAGIMRAFPHYRPGPVFRQIHEAQLNEPEGDQRPN